MGKGAMGLFGANMADFQLGLALDDKAGGYLETDEEIAQARSPRFEVLRGLHFVDVTRGHLTMPGVVSFLILSRILRRLKPKNRRCRPDARKRSPKNLKR